MVEAWQRFRSWMLWRFAVEQDMVEGLAIRASVPFSETEETEYLAPVRGALALLAEHEPMTLEDARRLLRGIFVCQSETGGAVARYVRRDQLIVLNPVYLEGDWVDPVWTAMTLAHEIMHARVFEAGIQGHQGRVERLCYKRAVVFGKRCGASKRLMEWAREEMERAETMDVGPITARRWIEEAQSTELPRLYRWIWRRRIRQVERELEEVGN